MGKCGRRSWVSQVISWHIDSLERVTEELYTRFKAHLQICYFPVIQRAKDGVDQISPEKNSVISSKLVTGIKATMDSFRGRLTPLKETHGIPEQK